MVYIYILTPKSNPNDIRYVGKTNNIKDRLRRHKGSYYLKESTHKNNWIKKVLSENDDIDIKIIDTVEEDNWEYWESYWIEQFKAWGFNLTNGTTGGEGIRLINKLIEKRSNTIIENTNIELRDFIESYKIRDIGDVWIGERTCKCGKKIEYENKVRSRLFNTLRRVVREDRGCIYCKCAGEKNHFYGKKLNDGDEKRERYGKKVLQLTLDGEILNEYGSIREASRETGIDRKSISNCCKKIKSYNTAGGFKFKYKENEK